MTAAGAAMRVFVRGAPGLKDWLASRADGGRLLEAGFREMVAEAHPSAPEVTLHFESGDLASFREALVAGGDETSAGSFSPDLVILSLEAELRSSTGQWGQDEAGRFEDLLREVVRLIKEHLSSHVFVVNASSVDPGFKTSSYAQLDYEPPELRAHRFNLAAIRVSSDEGISIIDADRLIAELGGSGVVRAFLEYEAPAAEAISRETLRVVEDYGFLDNRPLLPQVGRNA